MFSQISATRTEQCLAARWVFPVSSPPLELGLVVIRGDRIAAVESHGSRTPDVDLGNAAIIPGLVNAHTHLDLSGLRGKVPPSSNFIGWLKQIIAHRRTQTPEQIEADIRVGLDEALRFGTTLIGDITADGASWPSVSSASLWSIVFREILGLPQDRALQIWRDINAWIRATKPAPNAQMGLSPHAPYSVSATVLSQAPASGHAIAVHLAETRDEVQLINERAGPFVRFLEDLGVWEPASVLPSFEFFLNHSATIDPSLLIHCNYLPIEAPIPRNATVVYCPRTHAAFGHAPHPFRDFLKRGVRVALGTDSLASNPDLDLLAEACFIHERYPDFPGEQLLRMATLSGAEALGWQSTTGSIEAGKSADLAVVPLPARDSNDPHSLLFDATSPVARRQTMWRGQWR